MNLQRLYVLLLLLIFVLPVVAAIGWDVSDQVYLSSMSEEENHVGIGISELVLLSSMEEDLGHIGEGISSLVYLSSMSEEENHLGEGLSEGAADRHDFADALHVGRKPVVGTRELLEGEARNLGDHIVDRGLEAGRGGAGDVVEDFVEGVPHRQAGGDLGDREASGL